jgi:hypothetical protein
LKVKYIGESFGVDSMTDGKEYDVLEVDGLTGALRIVDNSGEDYLYHPKSPKPNGAKRAYGRYEIIEDDENGSLKRAIYG